MIVINNLKIKMMTNEYPKTKAVEYEIETKTLLSTVEFSKNSISITLKENDEDYEKKTYITLDTSEQLSDLVTIINKINSLNLGE